MALARASGFGLTIPKSVAPRSLRSIGSRRAGVGKVEPYQTSAFRNAGLIAPFNHCLVAIGSGRRYLTTVDDRSGRSAKVRRTIHQEGRGWGYRDELFGRHLTIRPVVAGVEFEDVDSPATGSFPRNEASRRPSWERPHHETIMWRAVLGRAADCDRTPRIPGDRLVAAVRLATETGCALASLGRTRSISPRVDAR